MCVSYIRTESQKYLILWTICTNLKTISPLKQRFWTSFPKIDLVPCTKDSLWTWHVTSPVLQNETLSVKCICTSGDFMRNLTELFLCTVYKKQKERVNSFSWQHQHWQRNPLLAYCALLTISIKQFGQNVNSTNDLMDGGNRTFCYITK